MNEMMSAYKGLKAVTLPRLLAMTYLSLLLLPVLAANASDDLPNNHSRSPTVTVGDHSNIGFSVNSERLLIIDVSINITTLENDSADHTPISMFYENIDTRFWIIVDDFDSIYGSDDTDRKEAQASAGKTLIDVAHEVRLGSDIKCRSSRNGDRKAMEQLRQEESYYIDEKKSILYNCVGIVHILLPLSRHATNASKLDNIYFGEDDLYSSSTPIIVALWVSSNCENKEIDAIRKDRVITKQLVHLYEMVSSISLQANYNCLHYSPPKSATYLYPNPNDGTVSGVKDVLRYRITMYIYSLISFAALVYLNRLIRNDKQNRISILIDNDNIHTNAAIEDCDYSEEYQESDDEHQFMMGNDDASERSKQYGLLSRNVDYESSLDDDDANAESLSNPPSVERRATSSTDLNWLSTEPYHQHNIDGTDIVSIGQPVQENSYALHNIAATSMHHDGNDCTSTTQFLNTTIHTDIVQELAVDRNVSYSSTGNTSKQFGLIIQNASMDAVVHKRDKSTFEAVEESCPIASSSLHESRLQSAWSPSFASNAPEKSVVNLISFVPSAANIDTLNEGVEHDFSIHATCHDAMYESSVKKDPKTYIIDVDETIEESILPLPSAPRVEITKHTPSANTCLADNTVTVSNHATKRTMNSHATEKLDQIICSNKNSVAITPKCLEFIDHPIVPSSGYKRSRVVFHSDFNGDDEFVLDNINCKTDQSAPSNSIMMSTDLSLIQDKCNIKENSYEGLDLKSTSESTTIPTHEMHSTISSDLGSIKSTTVVVKPSTTDDTTLKQGSHKKRLKFAGTLKATTSTVIDEKAEKSTSEITDTKSPDDFSYVSTLPPNSICSDDTTPFDIVNDLTASSPNRSVLVSSQDNLSPRPYQLHSATLDHGDRAESLLAASGTYLRTCNQEHTVRPDIPISNALLLAAEEVKENVWIYDESGNGSIVRTWTTKKRDKSLPKSISIQKKRRKRK